MRQECCTIQGGGIFKEKNCALGKLCQIVKKNSFKCCLLTQCRASEFFFFTVTLKWAQFELKTKFWGLKFCFKVINLRCSFSQLFFEVKGRYLQIYMIFESKNFAEHAPSERGQIRIYFGFGQYTCSAAQCPFSKITKSSIPLHPIIQASLPVRASYITNKFLYISHCLL